MPSAKILEAKKAEVAAIGERLQGACAGVIVDYKGINVADDTALRKELREAGVEYTVTKNTMIELAIKGTDLEGLSECLEGTTALATSTDDYVAAARILSKFASTHENFKVKSGFLDNEVISCRMVARSELFYFRSFGKGHIVLIGRYNLIGVFLGSLLDHLEK